MALCKTGHFRGYAFPLKIRLAIAIFTDSGRKNLNGGIMSTGDCELMIMNAIICIIIEAMSKSINNPTGRSNKRRSGNSVTFYDFFKKKSVI